MRKKRTPGFTLVELIVIIAIIGLIALIAVPSLTSSMREAELARYDEHAKTIFLAAETRLTNMKYSGELDSLNTATQGSKLTDAEVPAIASLSNPDDSDVRYMRFDINSASQTDELYKILRRQLNDNNVLNAAVLVEYSAATGRVYSVFYSEEATGFRYTGEAGGVVISDRTDMDALKRNGRFGYYGVDDLNVVIPDSALKINNAELINGERLYFTWQLESATGDSNTAFTIALKSKDGTLRYSFCVDAADIGSIMTGVPIQLLSHYDITLDTTNSTLSSSDMKHCLYKDGLTYCLVLDAYDLGESASQDTYSIRDRYPDIPVGEMYCEIFAEDKTIAGSATQLRVSNVEHTLFTFNDPATGSAAPLIAGSYGIAWPRHLRNIRLMSADTDYVQLQPLDFAASAAAGYITNCGNMVTTPDYPVPMFLTGNPGNPETAAYSGSYTGNSMDITGANILRASGQPAGLFGELAGGGIINGVSLNTCTVGRQLSYTGVQATGGIAGINNGTISSASVFDTSVYGGDMTGGIVGENAYTGSVRDCSTSVADIADPGAACVNGGDYTGGIAGAVECSGLLFGSISDSTNGMAVEGSGAYVGGVVGSMDRDNGNSAITLENCTNTGRVKSTCTLTSSYLGGITGYCRANLTIKGCTNSGDVSGSAFYVGGITGHLLGALEDCAAEGGTVTGTHNDGYVGGVAAYMSGGDSSIAYTSAFPRTNGMIKIRTNVAGTGTKQHVGGYVGRFYTDIDASQLTVSKVDFAAAVNYTRDSSESCIGGITGRLPTPMTIDDCTLTGEVNGTTGRVGGIVGINYGTVKNIEIAFAATPVKVTSTSTKGNQGTGGVIGVHQGTDATANLYVGTDEGAGLKAPVISGYENVGGVIGAVRYDSAYGYPRKFEYMGAYADVTGTVNTGGVVGNFFNTRYLHVLEFVNYGTVKGRASANAAGLGGCVGRIGTGTISTDTWYTVDDCVNLGKVYNLGTSSGTGGIVGLINGATASAGAIQVTNCTNSGSVEANTQRVGGICGEVKNGRVNFENCTVETNAAYSAYGVVAEVRGYRDSVGGIAGDIINVPRVTISGCRVDCLVYCDNSGGSSYGQSVGGMVGANSSTLALNNNTLGSNAVLDGDKLIGGMVGMNSGDLTINTCVTEQGSQLRGAAASSGGSLHGAGGMVGVSSAGMSISGCVNNMSFRTDGMQYVGGIAGSAASGSTITDCKNYSDIGGVSYLGGIAGYVGTMYSSSAVSSVKISYCGNYAGITGSGSSVGGIAGSFVNSSGSEISNCVNYGALNCGSAGYVECYGGILGSCGSGLSINGCVNLAHITSYTTAARIGKIGGIAGALSADGSVLSNCVNVGSIALRNYEARYVGGIAGYLNNSEVSTSMEYATAATALDSALITQLQSDAAAHNTVLATDLFTHVAPIAMAVRSGKIDLSTVDDVYWLGGIVGRAEGINGKILSCSANANIDAYGSITSATSGVGGIAGRNDAQMDNCQYSGTIMIDPSADGANVGGLAGYQGAGTGACVSSSSFTGEIQGLSTTSAMRTYRGGIIGFAEADSSLASTVIGGSTYISSGVPPLSITGGVQEPGLPVGNWGTYTGNMTDTGIWVSLAPARMVTPVVAAVRTNVTGDITETPTYLISWGDALSSGVYDVEIIKNQSGADTVVYSQPSTTEVSYETGELEECILTVRAVCKGDGSALIDSERAEFTLNVPARLIAPSGLQAGAVLNAGGTLDYEISWVNDPSATAANCGGVSIYKRNSDTTCTLIGFAPTAGGVLPERLTSINASDMAEASMSLFAIAHGMEGLAETSLAGQEYTMLALNVSPLPATLADDTEFISQPVTVSWTDGTAYAAAAPAQYTVDVIYGYGTPYEEYVYTSGVIDTNSTTFCFSGAYTPLFVYLSGEQVSVWVTIINPGAVTPAYTAVMLTLPTIGGTP